MGDAESLEELDEEKLRARDRFRELLEACGLKQEPFADATGGLLSRVEVNNAARGRNQYTTQKWMEGIAKATGSSFEDVSRWRRGELSAEELVQRARVSSTSRFDTLERLFREHKDDFTLADQEALRAVAFADGQDLTESGWYQKRDELRALRKRKAVDPGGGDTDDADYPKPALKSGKKRP